MTAAFLYGGAGILLFALGLWSLLVHEPLLRKLIALNIMGAGVFHVFIAVAHRGDGTPPDPVPHALVLTGIVVAVSATALALALHNRLEQDASDSAQSTSTSTAGLLSGLSISPQSDIIRHE
ncbi:MAG: Na+/H+ antiporter subunit C [Halochromatium sp.]|nr:Na+/H+ antiporter subunit C [Halochromatium sp.]